MSQVLYAKWLGLGYCPVVFDDDGNILREVALWLANSQPKCSPSTLTKKARALALFNDYWIQYHPVFNQDQLLRGFWDALIEGDPNLAWSPIRKVKTASSYFRALNEFTDWIVELGGFQHPNPMEERPMTWTQMASEYSRRLKSDLFAHLFSTTRRGQGFRPGRKMDPAGRILKRGTPHIARPSKVFDFQNYIKLVESEENPRDLALWLLLGSGGPRVSEALHLFATDVRLDDLTSEARICLSDPQYGLITTMGAGEQTAITRKQYLEQQFGLVPRDLVHPRSGQFLGWKGMLIHDDNAKTSEITWLSSDYGKLMWLASRAYWKRAMPLKPQHPWFFVNLRRNRGEPLTPGAVYQILRNACRRHGFRPPHHPHTLRHMYVDILVNVFYIPLHLAQVLVRHRSPESTALYSKSSLSVIQSNLLSGANKLPTLRLSI